MKVNTKEPLPVTYENTMHFIQKKGYILSADGSIMTKGNNAIKIHDDHYIYGSLSEGNPHRVFIPGRVILKS